MTEYVILECRLPGTSDEHWIEKVQAKASSPKRALTTAQVEAGEYVAVPLRSWKRLTVKSETVTKITIG